MKHWPLFAIANLLILVISGTTRAVGDLYRSYKPDIQNRLTGDDFLDNALVPNARTTRSALGTTKAVIEALLRNAKEVPTSSTKYRKVVKHGTLQDAYADFNKLKSTTVFRESYVRKDSIQGFVGDTELRFQIKRRWPTILIYPKDSNPIKLIYIDRKELY